MAKGKRLTIKAFLDGLSRGEIHETTRRVDWSEVMGENGEGFRTYSVDTCQDCGKHVYSEGTVGEAQHRDVDGDSDCMGYLNFSEPMMNFFYPCSFHGIGVEGAARALDKINTCCVVVEMEDGETGFALAGGGMDLTWDIAGAYVACGALPPIDKTRLPRFAGNTLTAHKRRVIAACIKSHEVAMAHAKSEIEDLKRLRKGMSKKAQERRAA